MSVLFPIFPLQLVVFPGEELSLHIFEPRYRELIHDCRDHGIRYGIPCKIKDQAMDYGTTIELVEISRTYPDGKMDVRCRGLEVFKIKEIFNPIDGKLYAGAEFEMLDNIEDVDYLLNENLIRLVREFYDYLKINKTIEQDPVHFDLFQVAHKIGLTLNQELKLLSILSQKERQKFAIDHLENLLPVVKKMEDLRRKIQMNGHFKNVKS